MVYLNPDDSINVILAVVLMAAFLAVFFFSYMSLVEKEIVMNQVDYINENIFAPLGQVIPNNYNLEPLLDNISMPDMSESDAQVDAHNEELLNQAAKVMGILLVVGLALAYYLTTKIAPGHFNEYLKDNVILILAIGFVEFIFATYVAVQFQSGDPNFVKRRLIQKLRTVS